MNIHSYKLRLAHSLLVVVGGLMGCGTPNSGTQDVAEHNSAEDVSTDSSSDTSTDTSTSTSTGAVCQMWSAVTDRLHACSSKLGQYWVDLSKFDAEGAELISWWFQGDGGLFSRTDIPVWSNYLMANAPNTSSGSGAITSKIQAMYGKAPVIPNATGDASASLTQPLVGSYYTYLMGTDNYTTGYGLINGASVAYSGNVTATRSSDGKKVTVTAAMKYTLTDTFQGNGTWKDCTLSGVADALAWGGLGGAGFPCTFSEQISWHATATRVYALNCTGNVSLADGGWPLTDPSVPAPSLQSCVVLGAPTLSKPIATSTSTIALSWSSVPNAANYLVYLNVSQIDATAATGDTVHSLMPSTNYCFYVVAVGANGQQSPPSNTDCATTQSPPPPPPQCQTCGKGCYVPAQGTCYSNWTQSYCSSYGGGIWCGG